MPIMRKMNLINVYFWTYLLEAGGLAQLWPSSQIGRRRTTNLELAVTRGIQLFN